MSDEGEWLVFIRDDDSIGSLIKVDVALRYERLQSHNWFEIKILFSREQLDRNGVPTVDATKLFFSIEEELRARIAPIGGRFAATLTNQTARSIFVHGPHDLDQIIQKSWSTIKGLAISVQPAEFSDVLALMPSKLEMALGQDGRIIDTLNLEGDDGQAPRRIRYWIHGVVPDAMNELELRLIALGFAVEQHRDKSVVFTRIAPVALFAIQEDTRSLFELCEEFGCTYDGWETEVIRPKLN
jgi:hypothetical protein